MTANSVETGQAGSLPFHGRAVSPEDERPTAIVLTPRLPWPLDDGGRIAAWQVVWSSTRAYRTILVSLVPPGTENDPLPAAFVDLDLEVIRIPHRPPPAVLAVWQGAFGRWPYTLARYRNRRLDETLRRLVVTRRPAFAIVNNLHLSTYADALGEVPMILREQNVEYAWMERYAISLGRTPRAGYAHFQARRLRVAEASLCGRAALVLAIQQEEAEKLRNLCPGAHVETLPVGIDLARFPAPRRAEPPTVLLVGSFAWSPNARGAIRFLTEGWPRVAAALPRVKLRLAGKDPSPELRKVAGAAGVEVAGDVESMEHEFALASALVVPLWVGAGARVKIVEAFAARLPVVSTGVGAEGLGITPGSHYVRGDTPAELAEGLVTLLRSAELGETLELAGRRLVEERWTLEGVARIQNRLCARVVDAGAARAPGR